MEQQQQQTGSSIVIPREFWISKDARVIFVSDFFLEDYTGGAELTLESLYETCPLKSQKIHSTSLTYQMVEDNKDKLWILVNYSLAKREALSSLVLNKCNYVIVECDYKYCKHRSEHHHFVQEKKLCDCHEVKDYGKWTQAFYRRAQSVYFMSETQRDTYISKFPNMATWTNLKCQYSTWSKKDLDYLVELSFEHSSEAKEWAILHGGSSWIKNQAGTETYCKTNNMPYKVVPKLPYRDFLKELNKYKGLVFHPIGYDTCPRLVVEAKVLGLELDINENVQMRNESWFTEPDPSKFLQFLYDRPKAFWESLTEQNLVQ